MWIELDGTPRFCLAALQFKRVEESAAAWSVALSEEFIQLAIAFCASHSP